MKNRNSWDPLQNHVPVKNSSGKHRKKRYPQETFFYCFWAPKTSSCQTGITNLGSRRRAASAATSAATLPTLHYHCLQNIKNIILLTNLFSPQWKQQHTATTAEINWPASEVQNKMTFMGHQISSCHVPVVRSFFIYFKVISSSWNCWYDHLPKYINITLKLPNMTFDK